MNSEILPMPVSAAPGQLIRSNHTSSQWTTATSGRFLLTTVQSAEHGRQRPAGVVPPARAC